MNNYILAGLVILTALACLGCSSSTDFPVAKAEGIVLHEGQPVAYVAVEFAPVGNSGSAVTGARAWGATDENGKFVLATYDAVKKDGAIVGKHNVRVSATPDTDRNTTAALSPFNIVTEVDVVRGKPNNFTFELPRRAPRERLVIPRDDD